MKNKRYVLLAIVVFTILLIITGATYAFWSWNSNNKSIVFNTASNLQNYIIYDNGEGVFSGTLQVGDDYTDGIHTTISIYKTDDAASVNLKATIHMDVNQIGTNMQNSKALKWVVTNGNSTNVGTTISTGDFVGVTSNSSIILATDLDVTLSEREYTIWIWLDERENPPAALTGETLDTNAWTEVNQYEGVADVYEITKLSASYQVVYATVINRKNKIVSYAVSTSSSDPGTWHDLSQSEQNNIYNLRYLVSSADDYYVWFKDSADRVIHSATPVTVSAVNNNAPVCSFGQFSQSVIKYNNTATIDITCTDENTTIISDLQLSDLSVSGGKITLTSLTKTKITNGYKYTVTVTAGSSAGNSSITLPADKVINNFNEGNEQVSSDNIAVNNDTTSPTFTVTVSNGTTYAKQKDATITITDNVKLKAGTYTVRYDWSETALTCNQLGNTVDLVVAAGETTKSTTVTISNQTGAGKIYVCNDTAILDEVDNQVAANTNINTNMYLDNAGPAGSLVLEQNGGIKATLNVTDSNSGIQTPYYFTYDDQPFTCDENTTGFTAESNNFTVYSVTQVGTYYICGKTSDTLGNTKYYYDSIDFKAYLKKLDGDNDAFKDATYKTNITNIYFVNHVNIPVEAVETYNLDESNIGLIKGWIVPNTEETGKYKLYIGSNDTIYGRNLLKLFDRMSGVKQIVFTNFDTSEATTMESMFNRCSALEYLDLSNFDTSNVTNMLAMFNLCSNLYSIYVSPDKWDTSNVTTFNQIFYNCNSLVGGNGTMYNSSYTPASMAVIDTSSIPGYLTATPSTNALEYGLSGAETTKYLSTDILRNQIKKITFTNSITGHTANGTDTWDVSFQKNGSVLAWVGAADGNGQYEMTIGQAGGVVASNGHSLFERLVNLTTFDGMQYFNVSNVTLTRAMFYECNSITSLDLSSWNTSKVATMRAMFFGCQALTSLNLNNFNTAKVTTMFQMFYNCYVLSSLNLSSFNTSLVTNMSEMFLHCDALTTLDLSNFNTSNVTDMSRMFRYCANLTSIDLSSFDTENVTAFTRMFSGCSSLKILDLSSFDTSSLTNFDQMFYSCSALQVIYVSSTNWDISNVTSDSAVFYNCTNLIGGNGTKYNSSYQRNSRAVVDTVNTPGYLTAAPTASVLERGTDSDNTGTFLSTSILKNQIKKITFTNSISGHTANGTDTWDVSFQKNGSVLAWVGAADGNGRYEMTIGQTGGVVPFTGDYLFNNLNNLLTIDGLQYFDTTNVTIMRSMFEGCTSLTTLDLSTFNTANVRIMLSMFNNCSNLTTLNISSFNTANVTTMQKMFQSCMRLTSLNLSHFNTSEVTSMNGMFYDCRALTTLNVSSFNTAKVTSMADMFRNCYVLSSLDVSSFSTSNVTTMAQMFQNCYAVEFLDVSKFDTSNVTTISSMFNGCKKLNYLNLGNFSTSKVTGTWRTFYDCNNLLSIYVSSTGWNMSKANNTAGVLAYVNAIAGGNGTVYNSSNQGISMAVIDASGTPGYLTAAPSGNALEPGSIKANTTKFLTTNILKNQIKKITFTNSITGHTANGTDTWDVSFQKNGSVLAWVGAADGNGRYEMTIGQTNGVVVLNGYGLFANLNNLTAIDGMQYLDVSNVTLMRSMFEGCSSLTTLDLSYWNTSNVKLMNNMFKSCSSLTTIYAASGWTTSNVINSTDMFTGATGLPNFNSSVVDATNAHTGTGGYLTLKP